ncbi:hypothetical protein RRG08_035960 [Elysia crispata]|uniref:Integrase catalytic domain-containing protein n=1 Tax=Elysia crispata TaxID=231223 RepID=A0AAE0XRM2_9GAST|nr:hypothetical protein RRG08_035960 [Elysia crispata]
MARAQAASIDVQAYKTAFSCLEITNTRLNEQGPELVCDVSTGSPRPIVPPDFRRTVFDVVHNLTSRSQSRRQNGLRQICLARDAKAKAIPLRGITTPECVHAVITGWIAPFGVHGDISPDRGSQFTSSLWSEIAARLGVKLHHTSAYHPQANGMIERFHRTLKTALKARLTDPNWTLPVPIFIAAKHVYVRRDGTKGPLQKPYSGRYAVLTPGDKTFLIDIGGRAERISVDRIKPAFFDPFQPVILAKRPPPGRPPTKQSHPSRSHPSDSSTTSKHQQAMSRPAVQTSSRTGPTIRSPMRYQ